MKQIILIVLLSLISVPVQAGNVQHFTPDIPLSANADGLQSKVDDLCSRASGDISWYVKNNFEYQKFIQQFDDTKQTIRQNQDLRPSEKLSLTQSVSSCKLTILRRMSNLQQMQSKSDNLRQQKINALPTLKASDISARIVRYDSIGNTWFSVKADVVNTGEPKSVSVRLQAVDSDGYELTTLILTGFVEKGQTATLTYLSVLSSAEYNKIKEWKVISIR